MSYYNKYLKYKLKYINLIGGYDEKEDFKKEDKEDILKNLNLAQEYINKCKTLLKDNQTYKQSKQSQEQPKQLQEQYKQLFEHQNNQIFESNYPKNFYPLHQRYPIKSLPKQSQEQQFKPLSEQQFNDMFEIQLKKFSQQQRQQMIKSLHKN